MKILNCVWALLLVALSFGTLPAADGSDDIVAQRDCVHCGMDRKVYGYSRMLVEYADGSTVGICSLHCAVTEMNAQKDKKVTALLVADRDSHLLIDAQKAVWVMGGEKRGVMTMLPKWAFAKEPAAEAFVSKHGGMIVGWPEVLKAAQEESRSRR